MIYTHAQALIYASMNHKHTLAKVAMAMLIAYYVVVLSSAAGCWSVAYASQWRIATGKASKICWVSIYKH